MRMLRDRFGLLLIMSLAGCHADVKHGYRRGIPSMSAAGQPQFSMEQVRTASFRPGLPPTELAQVRLERWPRATVYGDSSTDASMNWSESTVDSTVLAPDRTESAHGDALTGLDTEPATEHEQLALASPPPPKDITYRRPVVRIGLLDLLKQRLQSGHHVIENKACGARDWCRQTGQACQDQGMEFRTQFGEVWDEVNPQYWVGSACQSCGEHTRQFSSTLRERADDVCCPDWIGPAKERLASAGERLGGGLEGATEKLGRVTEQLNEVTDNLDYLQPLSDLRPLSDLHPEVALPQTELKRFLQPILKMPGQHPGPPQEDGTTLHDVNATTPEVIELPPPADLSDDEKADTKNKTKAEERHSSASDDIDASAESKPSEKAPYRRSVRKTDRWKGSLR